MRRRVMMGKTKVSEENIDNDPMTYEKEKWITFWNANEYVVD